MWLSWCRQLRETEINMVCTHTHTPWYTWCTHTHTHTYPASFTSSDVCVKELAESVHTATRDRAGMMCVCVCVRVCACVCVCVSKHQRGGASVLCSHICDPSRSLLLLFSRLWWQMLAPPLALLAVMLAYVRSVKDLSLSLYTVAVRQAPPPLKL